MDPEDAAREDSLVGRTIGSYRIERSIGRGGMGEVYRAQDLRLKRAVAAKSLRGERADNELARQRFVREARLASRVAHPYIATVFDVVDDRGVLLLVMEYIRGDTLHRKLKDGSVDTGDAVRWGLEIAEALQAIHEAGIVHRDLKPGNVMLAPNGHVKVTDFGVARVTAAPDSSDSAAPTWTESPGDFVTPGGGSGTVQYMSPEQVRGDLIDARSDLFSLGVILWEAIVGEHPFRRETRFETASAILSEPPGGGEIPEALNANPGLRELVVKLLQKDRERRHQDAAEVVAELHALANPSTPDPYPPWWDRVRRSPWSAVVAVGLVIGAAWAIYEIIQRRPPPGIVPDVRAVIAVLPFEDDSAPDGAEFEAEMVAALLAADLTDSRTVRALGNARTEEILAGLGPGAALDAQLAAIKAAAPVDWILAGEMFRAEGGYRATAELYRAGVATPSESFRVDASRASGLVDRIVAQVQSSLGGERGAADESGMRVASESDEANLLEYRGRRAFLEYRLSDAIALYEQALRIDPGLITAGIREAQARNLASEGAGAVNTIREVMERVDDAGDDLPPMVRFLAVATEARIMRQPEIEVEQRAALVDAFPDDPELLEDYAEALRRARKKDEARAAIDRAIALDGQDARLRLLLAQLLVESGNTDAALAEIEIARKLFEAMRSETGVAFVDLSLGHLRRYLAEYEPARIAYEAAHDRYKLRELSMLAAIARSNAADMLLRLGRLEEAESEYRETLAIAKAVGYGVLVAQDLNALGGAYLEQNDLTRAESYLREATAVARDLGSLDLLVSPLLNLAGVLGYSNRTDESAELAAEALDVARSIEDRPSESHARILLADVHFKQGKIEEAANDYREVVRIEEAGSGNSNNLIWGLIGLAEILGALGELGDAHAASTRAVELSAASEDPIVLGYPRLRHAWTLADLGRDGDVISELDAVDAVAISTSPPLSDLQARARVLRHISAAALQRPGAIKALEQTLDDLASAGLPQLRARGFVAAARLAVAEGDPEAGVRLARKAAALERLGKPARTEANATLALALALQGQVEEAAIVARRALADANDIDARLAVATAAAAIVATAADSDVPDVGAVGDQGRLALRVMVTSIAPEFRDRFRTRSDVRVLMGILEIDAG